MKKHGKVIVISGPSGAGKDLVTNILISRSRFTRFPTCTTRKARSGEVDGVHYQFVDEATFNCLAIAGEFLDCVGSSKHRFALPIKELIRKVEAGNNLIVHLLPNSAFMLKQRLPDVMMVFISPPSSADALRRLRRRGMSDEQIFLRQQHDKDIELAAPLYDLSLVNYENRAEEVVEHIRQFIKNPGSRS